MPKMIFVNLPVRDLAAATRFYEAIGVREERPLQRRQRGLDGLGGRDHHPVFRMRGGGAPALAAQGFLTTPPPARLLVLPATSHIGVMIEAETIVALVTPFLDDATPRMPPGFF